MQHLKGVFRKTSQTVVLPDGRKVGVHTEPTGVAVVRQIHDGDVMHTVVTPGVINMRLPLKQAEVRPDEVPLVLDRLMNWKAP